VGDTLVPSVLMSDGTHPSNCAGDTKEWPVYMTIGNLSSNIRQTPSTHSITMVALLTIANKNCNIPQKPWDEQTQTNREVLDKVLRRLLNPLTIKQDPSAGSGYYQVFCADGDFRRCKLVLAAWRTDCPLYSDLDHLVWHDCIW
jgi:hypothetical protein